MHDVEQAIEHAIEACIEYGDAVSALAVMSGHERSDVLVPFAELWIRFREVYGRGPSPEEQYALGMLVWGLRAGADAVSSAVPVIGGGIEQRTRSRERLHHVGARRVVEHIAS
jgi:hypothetical protein